MKVEINWLLNFQAYFRGKWKLFISLRDDALDRSRLYQLTSNRRQYQILGAKSFNLKWSKIRFTFDRRDGKTILKGM